MTEVAEFVRGVDTLVELLQRRAAERPDRTVFTFLTDGELEGVRWSYAELDRRARAIGAVLQDAGAAGERAILIYPPGLDFLSAFFGCLYGGVVAVPAYPPDPGRLARTLPRLCAIARDAEAGFVLTTNDILRLAGAVTATEPDLARLRWIASDAVPAGSESGWRPPGVDHDSVAFLQYTSGSTAAPKGVIVTYRNVMHNQHMIHRLFQQGEDAVGLSWLPLYHDMGLIGHAIHPIYIGATQYLMSPLAFLHRPLRWLDAVSRYRVTISGAPNFGYDLTARRVTPQQASGLDLSSWQLAFNGAEPIRLETMQRFAAAFERCGFRWSSFSPCYGLAEATLAVTGSAKGREPQRCTVERAGLEAHRVIELSAGAADSVTFVGSGHVADPRAVVIADPETLRCAGSDRVGEIWVTGMHVAGGYWNRPDETARTFAARLQDVPDAGPFLRTGDYGFILHGELYVTGRRKDLIIIGGRNYYPQDIELAAATAHPAVRPGCVVAFSTTVNGEEQAVVLVETSDLRDPPEQVTAEIRRAIHEAHDLAPHVVQLVAPRSLFKTSSGKIQRQACRAAWLTGTLR
jgi:acyl-CoA synthetase (AMP-forming)/AMP-acid ligase II